MTSLASVLLLAVAAGIASESAGLGPTDDWSYWGTNGPDKWPGVCLTGKKQSPINIDRYQVVRTDVEELKFAGYGSAYKATATNTGHTVQIKLVGEPMYLKGGGLLSAYVFYQMHLHWSAEHTIDGARDALELHLVHYATQYPNYTIASQRDHGLAVIAVLFKLDDKDNKQLGPIVDVIKSIAPFVDKISAVSGKITPSLLLPENKASFYRYDGSLTTPDCSENVAWFVLTEKLTVSKWQLNVFKTLMTHNGSLAFNYRPVQKLELRDVFYHPSGASMTSQKNAVYLSAIAMIISSLLFRP